MAKEKLKEYMIAYNSLKSQRDIIGNIDKNFFFDFVDCLLEKNNYIEKNNNIYGKFIF